MNFNTDQKKILWVVISLILLFIFIWTFWTSFLSMLSFNFIFSQHHTSPFGMLVLCVFFLFGKRKKLKEEMLRQESQKDLLFIIPGLFLLGAAYFLPEQQDFLLLKLAFVLTGVFTLIFRRAAKIPLLVLGIYTFVLVFPLFIQHFAEYTYARSAIIPVKEITVLLGFPLAVKEQFLSFLSVSGEKITVLVTAGCAGPATMGVFLGLFALMYLDLPIPRKKAIILFVFGIFGTWLQSVLRILILLRIGHDFGEQALWTAHFWTIYLLFPAWYLIFAVIYFT